APGLACTPGAPSDRMIQVGASPDPSPLAWALGLPRVLAYWMVVSESWASHAHALRSVVKYQSPLGRRLPPPPRQSQPLLQLRLPVTQRYRGPRLRELPQPQAPKRQHIFSPHRET